MNRLDIIQSRIKNIAENYTEDKTGGWITGDGPVPCNILIVGEAPGKTEIEKNKPFIGKAGLTFEKYLNHIGLTRTDVRITNACFFRPIKEKVSKNGKITISNRPPKTSEIQIFKEVLDEEIKLVNPKIIITLGNIPLKRLTEFKSIGNCHGELYYNESLKRYIFPMYHPSSLIYNRNDEFLNTFEKDWKKLKNVIRDLT